MAKILSFSPVSSGELDELDALLAESMDLQAQATRIKRDRHNLGHNKFLTAEEREALRATILRWESENEWNPQCFVAVQEEQKCDTCQTSSTHFVGLYQLQERKGCTTDRRFVLWAPQAIIGAAASLPRAFYTTFVKIPTCPICLKSIGFSIRYDGDLKP